MSFFSLLFEEKKKRVVLKMNVYFVLILLECFRGDHAFSPDACFISEDPQQYCNFQRFYPFTLDFHPHHEAGGVFSWTSSGNVSSTGRSVATTETFCFIWLQTVHFQSKKKGKKSSQNKKKYLFIPHFIPPPCKKISFLE